MQNGRVHLPLYFVPRVPPKVRGDCLPGGSNEARPCMWNLCKYYLKGPTSESCVLDIADRQGATLDEVGEILGITRERLRQIEAFVLRKIRRRPANSKLAAFLEEDILR